MANAVIGSMLLANGVVNGSGLSGIYGACLLANDVIAAGIAGYFYTRWDLGFHWILCGTILLLFFSAGNGGHEKAEKIAIDILNDIDILTDIDPKDNEDYAKRLEDIDEVLTGSDKKMDGIEGNRKNNHVDATAPEDCIDEDIMWQLMLMLEWKENKKEEEFFGSRFPYQDVISINYQYNFPFIYHV